MMKNPSELEMQILTVLFDKGPSTARDVLSQMPDGKKRAYTTVLSVMQKMEKKGLLKHSKEGAAHVFKPVSSRKRIVSRFFRQMMRNVFSDDPSLLMQTLVTEQDLAPEQVEEIESILNQTKKR